MPDTTAIRGVELVSEGVWSASTGITTITGDHLSAMLQAAQDPDVGDGPVKLGHRSPLNDGAPAYGWVRPTRIIRNLAGRLTLVGDLIGMPAKLAEVAPTAYRRRSVEIDWAVRTPGGRTYPAVLRGLALLGSVPPAVKSLADVAALYSQPTAAGTVIEFGAPLAPTALSAASPAGEPSEAHWQAFSDSLSPHGDRAAYAGPATTWAAPTPGPALSAAPEPTEADWQAFMESAGYGSPTPAAARPAARPTAALSAEEAAWAAFARSLTG